MRKKIAAGNWKMNLSAEEAQTLASEVVNMFQDEYTGDAEVIFSPSYPYLSLVHHLVKDNPKVHLAAQNIHQEEKGAYTGEVSAQMLTSIGCSHVLIGHSERRQYFAEDNQLLAKKIDIALKHGLKPVYCIGETLDQREAGETLNVNTTQLSEGAFHLDAEAFGDLVIAYEPVWAIGTGKTASPEQAQEVHKAIRDAIAAKYGAEVADNTTILYGGSVKPANAETLFSQPDIDGGLVGGASLKSRDFTDIIKAL
ncbi:triose-phosphate isomerase [Pontibacter sp. G13]|uniref:triose-phosphate isomerase n=1 Tax=Pontibacter sp. G13 TaxID=3074898 RepID=UPI00288A1353|nr:triose-phosphate isomerase [Pontibacter sp. G13]WNJ18018.1 triose-phosphate isomerase [Pontibacter sp. G13]